MLDIRDLEKRWLHYKIKSYIPHAVIALSIIVILSITLFVWDSSDTPEQITSRDKISSIEKELDIESIISQNNSSTIQKPTVVESTKPIVEKTATVVSQKMLIKPSLDFMKKMQSQTSPYYNQSNHNQMITPKRKKKILQAKPVIEETQEVIVDEADTKVEKEQAVEKVHKISIKRRNAKDDIAEIIQRFKKNNNPALSLFVAKKYYELGEYKKSYNYALLTNKINNEIESSWIIFAKSLVKLGEKDMAMKTLKAYIRSSHSNNAQLLLEDIRSGKFQ